MDPVLFSIDGLVVALGRKRLGIIHLLVGIIFAAGRNLVVGLVVQSFIAAFSANVDECLGTGIQGSSGLAASLGRSLALALGSGLRREVGGLCQQGALLSHPPTAEVERSNRVCQAAAGVGGVRATLGDPGMLESPVDSYAPLRLNLEHLLDEVKGRVSDGVPVGRRKLEGSIADLPLLISICRSLGEGIMHTCWERV